MVTKNSPQNHDKSSMRSVTAEACMRGDAAEGSYKGNLPIGLRFRGNAHNSNCSQRYLNANNSASNANVNNAGSAQNWALENKNKYRTLLRIGEFPCSGEAKHYKTRDVTTWQ